MVHYAGIGTPNDAGGPLLPDAMRVIDVNLLGAWRVTAAALPALLAGRAARGGPRGRVVFVASELAYLVLPFVSAYSVAKRAMTAYADALRVEYGSELFSRAASGRSDGSPIAAGLVRRLTGRDTTASAAATMERSPR